jgi:hypothetical protein
MLAKAAPLAVSRRQCDEANRMRRDVLGMIRRNEKLSRWQRSPNQLGHCKQILAASNDQPGEWPTTGVAIRSMLSWAKLSGSAAGTWSAMVTPSRMCEEEVDTTRSKQIVASPSTFKQKRSPIVLHSDPKTVRCKAEPYPTNTDQKWT